MTKGKGSISGNPLIYTDKRIRFITPIERWRLMGFDDEDFYKATKHSSEAQLYKQAGNSIVVNVLVHIFECLFNANIFKESNIGEYIMKCDKEIHFYVYECAHEQCVHSWKETEQSIVDFVPEIHTTQIGLMQTGLIVYCGYRIFIHDNPKNEKEYYEIKIDNCNERSNREIKEKHDIFKMWIAGEFERK